MAHQAYQQGGLLTLEDFAYRILNCGMRTLVRDMKAFRERSVVLPLCSTIKDMGRGISHWSLIIRHWLAGKEYEQIFKATHHSPRAVANYVSKFRRCVWLASQGFEIHTISFLVGISPKLTAHYWRLYRESPMADHRRKQLQEDPSRQNPSPEKKLPMNNNTTFYHKHYSSATQRLLKPQIKHFFATQFPKLFGPVIRGHIADSLLELFSQQVREVTRLKPGQILWNAVDIATRADSANRRFVPVVLTMVSEQDIQNRIQGMPINQIRARATARILREAYQQGGLLSMRDISLLCWHSHSSPTKWRKHYEQAHQCELPHPGNLQDMGSCITHKEQIVYKAIVQRKDPVQVASESKHTQKAVDRYLTDFHRVQTAYHHNSDFNFISLVTGISKSVVNQYITLIEKYDLNE